MTNTQKQRSTKKTVVVPRTRTSVQSSGSVESTESVKKGPKGIKASPNYSLAQSQEETYRVCKLHCTGPTFLFIKLNVNFQRVKRVCLHAGNCGRARPGAGAALEGRAGCKETF